MIKLNFTGYEKIEHLRDSLERYLNKGIEPGGFLAAVIENDLIGAFSRADAMNKLFLAEIVAFMYNRMPGNSCLRPGAMKAYIDFIQHETQS